MPVKVGNSYVTEAAYSYAQAQVAEESEGGVLQSLAKQFPNLKFSTNTAPFSASGLNNMAISPKILREMENDPEKRLEYEALIYDVAQLQITNPTVKSHGTILDANGGLSMWSVSQSGDDTKRTKTSLNKNEPKTWWQALLESLDDKRSAAAKVEISDKSKAAAEEDSEDKKPKGKVVFNEAKRARQLAAAETKDEVRAVMELLQKDLEDCKAGVEQEMCDENEVKKVEAMIERAEDRLNEVGDVDPTPNFSPVDILI